MTSKTQIKQLKFFPSSSFFQSTKEEFHSLLNDKILSKAIQFVCFVFGLNLLTLVFLLPKLPPQVPLLYTRPWGEEQLVNKNTFILFPLSCFIIILINFRLAGIFFRKEVLLSQILVWSSIIISTLSTITFIKILAIIL